MRTASAMKYNLTPKQERLYNFICNFIEEKDCFPKVNHMQLHMGVSSPTSIYNLLSQLKKRGYLTDNGQHDSTTLSPDNVHEIQHLRAVEAAAKTFVSYDYVDDNCTSYELKKLQHAYQMLKNLVL